MKRILLFAGTVEGRRLAEKIAGEVELTVCAATEYGGELLPKTEGVRILIGRLNREDMEHLMQETSYDQVVDATHPYAAEVTSNIMAACRNSGIPYLRLVRPMVQEKGMAEDTWEEAVEYLNQTHGNILLTTGTKDLPVFTGLKDYRDRVYIRLLPVMDSLKRCKELGFRTDHLCCMQGPFSEEMNLAFIRQWKIRFLVTKNSGTAGGFPEKYDAAKKAGIELIVIGRPKEPKGFLLEELLEMLGKEATK